MRENVYTNESEMKMNGCEMNYMRGRERLNTERERERMSSRPANEDSR